jgi:hypothetical protein
VAAPSLPALLAKLATGAITAHDLVCVGIDMRNNILSISLAQVIAFEGRQQVADKCLHVSRLDPEPRMDRVKRATGIVDRAIESSTEELPLHRLQPLDLNILEKRSEILVGENFRIEFTYHPGDHLVTTDPIVEALFRFFAHRNTIDRSHPLRQLQDALGIVPATFALRVALSYPNIEK